MIIDWLKINNKHIMSKDVIGLPKNGDWRAI
jgi:hypothetical protein